MVADKALQQRLTAAFAALQAQLASDPDAGQALQQWRARRAPLASEALASQQLRALPMGRQMVLAVASDAGARVAGLQEAALQRLLVSDNVTVAAAQPRNGTRPRAYACPAWAAAPTASTCCRAASGR